MIYHVASGIPAILMNRQIMKMVFDCHSSCRIPFRGTLVNTLRDGAAHCLRPRPSDSQYFMEKTIFKFLFASLNVSRHRHPRGALLDAHTCKGGQLWQPDSRIWVYLPTRWCNGIKIRAGNSTAWCLLSWKNLFQGFLVLILADKHHKYYITMHFYTSNTELFWKFCH